MRENALDLINQLEAAKIAGVNRITIWRWVKTGRLQGHRIADRVYFSRREVEALAGKRGVKR
ncbi:MAG: helix-turn-helix domain-containing protein [Anaerolineales bacterium]|jgi:predicted site-specific integrase-resolvase